MKRPLQFLAYIKKITSMQMQTPNFKQQKIFIKYMICLMKFADVTNKLIVIWDLCQTVKTDLDGPFFFNHGFDNFQ